MPILLFISLFTLLDFVLLYTVGSRIGLLATLALVLGTGFIGLLLIRKEGVSTLTQARQRMQMGEIPSREVLTGAALIFGGALLLAPGFLSDALGIACLLPSARQLLLKLMAWLGIKASLATRQGPAPEREPPHQHKPGSTSSEGPLEGDFISKDESSRRQ